MKQKIIKTTIWAVGGLAVFAIFQIIMGTVLDLGTFIYRFKLDRIIFAAIAVFLGYRLWTIWKPEIQEKAQV